MGTVLATPVEDAALKEVVSAEFKATEIHSFEGSGRFVKSFRLIHEGVPIIVKAVQLRISKDDSWCTEQATELKRLKNLRHTVSYDSVWISSTNPPLVGLAVRPFLYTTLADRLSCRPWLTIPEKLYLTRQIFAAVAELHEHEIYLHGGLTVHNVGLTSLHTVRLLDVGIQRPKGTLTGGLFHAWYKQHRCTVPPERFAGTSTKYNEEDVFSVACIITELFTGSTWDLGDILAHELPINNIEVPAVRACCKHMVSNDRLEKMSAYLDRLISTTHIESFEKVLELTRRMEEQVCPDARLALLVEDHYFANPTTTKTDEVSVDELSKSVETALKELETPSSKEDEGEEMAARNPHILYIHLVLATIRHVQRPASKVRGLELLKQIQDDETRLQRVLPVTVQLLQDPDAAVRSCALNTLTRIVSECTTFPPSDAQLFPEYVLKRVAPLISDPSWMVRLTLARCLSSLAVTALSFLDVSHAVRLHENTSGDTLENNTYAADLLSLQETISRWVLHICTDTSEHASFAKRALLEQIAPLSAFFASDSLFLLPQVLTFLNDRKDWELRAALFEHLPAVCHGRSATEEYVWPCLEIGLSDTHNHVVRKSLQCMARLVEIGLLRATTVLSKFFKPYVALVMHEPVRLQALDTLATIARILGDTDGRVYFLPPLDAYLRYNPTSWGTMTNVEDLDRIIKKAWLEEKWSQHLDEITTAETNRKSGTWTSVGTVTEAPTSKVDDDDTISTSSDSLEAKVRDYLRMIARRRNEDDSSHTLSNGIEGNIKLAQSVLFPRQQGLFQKSWLPLWYSKLREEIEESTTSPITEATAIRSLSTLGLVYGLSIIGPLGSAENIVGVPIDESDCDSPSETIDGTNALAQTIESAFAGDWISESKVPADILDTCLMVSKIKGLGVPPLAMTLGDADEKPVSVSGDSRSSSDSRPKIKSLIVTSSTATGHTAPVMRLAVSIDQRFFVSGSHDGTCRIWEIEKVEESAGLLESASVYTEHDQGGKINDIAMLEGTHSVVSGDSNGSIHIWRVDLAAPSASTTRPAERTRITGSSTLKRLNANEGEVVAVSHFNASSSCVATYATQRGGVRSWDLRAAREPFKLRHSPELGLLTSIALGSDRHWIVTGTRCGYIALWDLRYERCVKLWRHSRKSPISRLATSMIPPPQTWGSSPSNLDKARPSIFVATGDNECAMYDVLTGSCKECFRTEDEGSRQLSSSPEEPPKLSEVAIASNTRNGILTTTALPQEDFFVSGQNSINCMLGSIGAGHNSYLMTGGSDNRIRFWDFTTPSKCYVVCGQSPVQPRPTFERVDFEGQRRLMLCRQSKVSGSVDQHFHGMRKPDHMHTDSIQDIKMVNSSLISCSRDCTVKIWR